MRVFMTGASGFVGLNIVEALLGAGHEVHCFIRPGARRQFLERLPVRLITGSLDQGAQLADAMRGADAVIHTAGQTSTNWNDIDALRAANLDSTAAILRAARACGVARIVYTSSSATIGSSGEPNGADETAPLDGWRASSPYAQTKLAAEALLAAPLNGPACIILNPTEVIGAYDHTLQWGRIVLAVATAQLPFVPPGAGTFCPAHAVGAAHVAALTRGQHGQRYLLGGHNLSFADFFAAIGAVTGCAVSARDTRPYAVQRRLARQQERLGLPVAVDSYRMRVFGGRHFFNDGKARAELGYRAPPLASAIEECYRWYQANGFLPADATDVAIPPTHIEWTAA
ncbi:dihydroflavonol-4-reductase [Oxalobacteraceae bacterium GrIS 1.11]